ncbi:MAG: enoyl-CoA hydratase/isomerase family protein [Alphaproteobacteria bacterium]|nr:enoyl-CoA hydratase/isomerase family protein [Alphaproteobacteria bacterium]
MTDQVTFSVQGTLGIITLRNERALNALTLEMIRAIAPQLDAWAADDSIASVLIEGAGEKAFCAGGDVRAVWKSVKDPSAGLPTDLPQTFFREEYRLNAQIHHFPKPYIAWLDGITMGGGVGLSRHGAFRIATERMTFAMPETNIGLFPDVGGGWFLNECPGALGLYLGLTGARLKAADAMYAHIATHYMTSDKRDALVGALAGIAVGEGAKTAALRAIEGLVDNAGQPPIAQHRSKIDQVFRNETYEEIEAALTAVGGDWAAEVQKELAGKSPTSLKVVVQHIVRARGLSIEDVLKMEYRMVQRVMRESDFFEGIRALLVDKDHAPKWEPAAVSEISDDFVESFFDEPRNGDLTFS